MRYIAALIIALLVTATAQAQVVTIKRSSETVISEGERYYIHTVSRGETLYSLAKGYNVSELSIIDKNPLVAQGLKAKQKILIPTQTTYKSWQARSETKPKLEESGDRHYSLTDTTRKEEEIDSIKDTTIIEKEPVAERYATRDFDPGSPIKVAVLLPFGKLSTEERDNYVSFFNGVLLALDELKSKGISTDVRLISCGSEGLDLPEDSTETYVEESILFDDPDEVNLIIGPVYEDDLSPIAKWATENRIPVVSPLRPIGNVDSPFIFQATPSEETKYAKLKPLFEDPNSNIVVMKMGKFTDQCSLDEIEKWLPEGVYTMENVTAEGLRSLAGTLETGKENVIIIPTKEEVHVSSLLEKINLLNSSSRYKITVIGLPNWSRFTNINIETLYKLNTTYIANYHGDRTDPTMFNFYSKYIGTFQNLPTMFSMRGYDVATVFISALSKWGPRMPFEIEGFDEPLLQVKYHFEQDSTKSSFKNTEWNMVNYSPTYRIMVK